MSVWMIVLSDYFTGWSFSSLIFVFVSRGSLFFSFGPHSLYNQVAQSTDVMLAVQFLVRISKDLSRLWHIVII